jgi:hypothetical protein
LSPTGSKAIDAADHPPRGHQVHRGGARIEAARHLHDACSCQPARSDRRNRLRRTPSGVRRDPNRRHSRPAPTPRSTGHDNRLIRPALCGRQGGSDRAGASLLVAVDGKRNATTTFAVLRVVGCCVGRGAAGGSIAAVSSSRVLVARPPRPVGPTVFGLSLGKLIVLHAVKAGARRGLGVRNLLGGEPPPIRCRTHGAALNRQLCEGRRPFALRLWLMPKRRSGRCDPRHRMTFSGELCARHVGW